MENNETVGSTNPNLGQVTRAMTFGEKAVGLAFNSGQDPKVNEVKELYAKIIDVLAEMKTPEVNGKNRLLSIATTEAQGAQMWAVKAVTWKD